MGLNPRQRAMPTNEVMQLELRMSEHTHALSNPQPLYNV